MTHEELTSTLVALKQPSKVIALALGISNKMFRMWVCGSRQIPEDKARMLEQMRFDKTLDRVVQQNREALEDLAKR